MDYKIKVITEESTSDRMEKGFDKNKESIKAKEGLPPKKDDTGKEEPKKDPDKSESKDTKTKDKTKEKIGKFVKGTYNFVKNRVSDAAGGFGKSSFSEWRDRTR